MVRPIAPLAVLASSTLVAGQLVAPVQTTSWNSTYKLSPHQLMAANISDELAEAVNNAVNFDHTQLANGGPYQDDFYNLPHGLRPPKKGGKLLKLQEVTDPTNYTIPAYTSMSRFIYSTTNLNGTVVPASAYVLWPYQAKKVPGCKGKTPTVLWTHGTSGWYRSQAPSAHRSLFYWDIMPYALAQAGYAVVAPDYAGLGVSTSWDGSEVPHQYALYSVGAGDALNSLRAAFEAFPERLTSEYVNIGHSQGGVVSWGVTEALAQKHGEFKDLAKTHLGTVIFAPQPNPFALPPEFILAWVGKYLDKVFTGFKISDWLTPFGIKRLKTLTEVEGGQFVSALLLEPATSVVQPDWNQTWSKKAFQKLAMPGNKPYKGPVLFIQGDNDPAVAFEDNSNLVKSTCDKYPGDLEFVRLPGVGHFPGMLASKSLWMDWLDDRFKHREVQQHGCVRPKVDSMLPFEDYQHEVNNFPQFVGEPQWTYALPQGS